MKRQNGITIEEIKTFFDHLKEANKNSDTTIPISNDMCKTLYNIILDSVEYQKIKDEEIKELKEKLETKIDFYEDTISYQLGFDKGKEYMQQRINEAIEYITKQMKKYEGYDRDFEITLSNIVVILRGDKE